MAKAIDIKCPVQACSRLPGQPCKMVDLSQNPFMGNMHLKRVQEAQKIKEQDARELLRATNRIVEA